MKPDQPCKKQVSPPFSGEGLAGSWFLSSSFPLSHFVSCCLCWTRFLMLHRYMCPYIWPCFFFFSVSLSTFYSVHTQWFYHRCGCFLAHFLSRSLSAFISPPRLSTHTFLYLISALQDPCLTLGTYTSFCCCLKLGFLEFTGFSLTWWPQKSGTVAARI